MALTKLTASIQAHPDAPVAERFEAHVYRAELLVRLGRPDEALAALDHADALGADPTMTGEQRDSLAELRLAEA